MRLNTSLFLAVLLSGLVFLNQAESQEQGKQAQGIISKEIKNGTRIVISTSGEAKFNSFWLDDPPRLVVEFQTKNILSKIAGEVTINQGAIKRITSSYFEKSKDRRLKSLTFELLEKLPYKIWQEDNTILLDIQTPLETPVFYAEEKETFREKENSELVVRRLEAMEATIMQATENQPVLKTSIADSDSGNLVTRPKAVEESSKEINKAKANTVLPKKEIASAIKPIKERKGILGILFLVGGLALFLGLRLLLHRRGKAKTLQKFKELELELKEKDKSLEHEKTIRKAIERGALQKEKEYQEIQNSFKSLEDKLTKEAVPKKELPAKAKAETEISKESQEKRQSLRLLLTQDYNRTIILRIESPSMSEKVKSFANNISCEGLSFGTRKEFREKEPIDLRLFFYGDQIPIIKIKGHIVWEKIIGSINYYGIAFDLLEEKDWLELNRYIESKIEK